MSLSNQVWRRHKAQREWQTSCKLSQKWSGIFCHLTILRMTGHRQRINCTNVWCSLSGNNLSDMNATETQEIAKNQMHTMFKVRKRQGKSMPRLHCNVVAGCHHPNASNVAPRMSHHKQEKKAANATAKVDETFTRTQLE